jgi:hypothetical protein
LPRTVFFLGGDSYPADRPAEVLLRERLAGPDTTCVSHADIFTKAAKAAGPGKIDVKAKLLEQAIRGCAPGHDIFLIGRSAGARVATMAAHHVPVTAIACLFYPFRQPLRQLEPKRFSHLRTLATPTLLLQGAHDDYGGLEITEHYQLSPAIRLKFVAGNHNTRLAEAEGAAFVPLVVDFINGGWRETGSELEGFDEAYYLSIYPDVVEAVGAGLFSSGDEHFRKVGRTECRMYRVQFEG